MDHYKAVTRIFDNTTLAKFYVCLEEDLRHNMQKLNPSVRVADMTEGFLLAVVKRLEVKEESKLDHNIKIGLLLRSPGTSVGTCHANLNGTAATYLPKPYQTFLLSSCSSGTVALALSDSCFLLRNPWKPNYFSSCISHFQTPHPFRFSPDLL